MAHRSAAYLSRNKHGYCFRLKVPNDIQSFLGKKELRYSLQTGYLGVAKTRARFIAGNVQMLFSSIRLGESILRKLTPDVVNELLRKFRKEAIEIAKRAETTHTM